MKSVEQTIPAQEFSTGTVAMDMPPLATGDSLSRKEFLRRWEGMPNVKKEELIRGVVYMPSPVSRAHGDIDHVLGGWLYFYRSATPGCCGGNNMTWMMLEEEAPQPDTCLWIMPEYGGKVRRQQQYLAGAPDFLAETCLSSAAYDLHQKLEVYQEAGVREYLAILLHEREARWHRLVRGRFRVVPPDPDGVHRSVVLPGLWLDAAALLTGDLTRLNAVLNQGVASDEHAAFVNKLAERHERRRHRENG